jgi:hypothetical protein
MVKSLVTGLCLAVLAAAVIALSETLSLDLEHVALLGAALGGVLGLVGHRPGWGKVAGFGVGFLAAWLGYALRAGFLPDAPAGRAVAAFLVVAVVAVVAAVTGGRLPLWSGLLGAAAIVGAYEDAYTAAPPQFLSDSPGAATTVLLAVALGFLVTNLLPLQRDSALAAVGAERGSRAHARPAEQPDRRPDGDDHTSIDDLVTGAAS